MISRACRFAWMSLAVLVCAFPCAAAVPSPSMSLVDPVLVGDSNGMSIVNPFHVIVRDAAGNPVPNSRVSLHFGTTGNAVHAYTVQTPPLNTSCPVVTKFADGTGFVVFNGIRFGGYVNGPVLVAEADGVTLRMVQARSTDTDHDGATNIVDFGVFRSGYLGTPGTHPELDFDQNGSVDVGDFSIFRQVYLNDTPGTPCP